MGGVLFFGLRSSELGQAPAGLRRGKNKFLVGFKHHLGPIYTELPGGQLPFIWLLGLVVWRFSHLSMYPVPVGWFPIYPFTQFQLVWFGG